MVSVSLIYVRNRNTRGARRRGWYPWPPPPVAALNQWAVARGVVLGTVVWMVAGRSEARASQ